MKETFPTKVADHRIVFSLDYLNGLGKCLDALSLEEVVDVLGYLEDAYRRGSQVFIIGNGGSAALASHMACDLGKNIHSPASRGTARRLRVMSLTDNVSWISALGNDMGYEHIFSEQLQNLAQPGDLVVAISGSGNSPNILEGIKTAQRLGAKAVGLLGFQGGQIKDLLDACVVVPSNNYGHIEDLHTALVHLMTAYFKFRCSI